MTVGKVAVSIRPFRTADAEALAALHNRQEGDSAPRSADELSAEQRDAAGSASVHCLVAAEHERVLGYVSWREAWWTGRPDVSALELRVERARWGEGIGSRLFSAALEALTAQGAARLLAWIRSDLPQARRFAVRHRFTDTGQVIEECRLFLPDARVEGAPAVQARLAGQGIRLASLAEIAPDEPFLRALQQLWGGDGGADEPAFETWRAQVLEGAGASAQTHWVALEGSRPVGTTLLKLLAPESAENDYTAVLPSHRGRGLAFALKLHAIAWGRDHGLRWYYTSSLLENAPMIAVNRKLGYRPGARRQEVTREVNPSAGGVRGE